MYIAFDKCDTVSDTAYIYVETYKLNRMWKK